MLQKLTLLQLLLIFLPSLASLHAQHSEILFLGSSSTYFHEMPMQVASRLDRISAYGNVTHHWVGESGTWTWKYLNEDYRPKSGLPDAFTGNVLDYIRQNNFRWISLQVALGQWDEWKRTIPQYAQAAKASESQLLLYEQSWKPDTEKVLANSPLLQIAQEQALTIVPCASAWDAVYKDYPKWDLQDSYFSEKRGYAVRDGTHPGLLGNYLNQACFLAAITGRHPDGLMPNNFYHHDRMAHPESKLYIPPGITLIEPSSNGLARFSLEPSLGKYLRKVAWETYSEVRTLQQEVNKTQ